MLCCILFLREIFITVLRCCELYNIGRVSGFFTIFLDRYRNIQIINLVSCHRSWDIVCVLEGGGGGK